MMNGSRDVLRAARIPRVCLASVVLIGLSSCSLAPNIDLAKDAEIPLTESYSGNLPSGDSVANTPWWELFKDQELEQLIRGTLKENRTLKVSSAQIAEARALVTFVRAEQFPFLDLNASAQRADLGNAISATGPFNDFGAFGDLSFEVDLWGRLRNATEAQMRDLQSSEYAYRSVTISLVSEVAQLYFSLIDLDNRIAVAERTITNRHNATELINARFSKGITPMLDVNQAQIEEAQAKISLASLQRESRLVENALQAIQGQTSGEIKRSKTLADEFKTLEIPAGVPAALLSRRPDVQAAEETVRAEYARIGVAEAERLPTLSLFGSLGLRSSDDSNFLDADSKSWGFGGGLFSPLIDWGKNKARAEAQTARAEQAVKQYEETVIRAVEEVNNAIASVETYKQEYLAWSEQKVAAANAARLSWARYNDGVAPYLEVLDIERSLFDAELGESLTYQLYLSSIVKLYKALGGGWEMEVGGSPAMTSNPKQ